MRLPPDILDRVRGALIVAALTSCSHESKVPPPAPSAVTAGVASAPAPAQVDPVRYASADEAERLTRLDTEEAASVKARRARLAALHREDAREQEMRAIEAALGTPGTIGSLSELQSAQNLVTSRQLSNIGCNACGRG